MIRAATPADVDAFVEMGRRMAEEAPRWRSMPYLPDKVRDLTSKAIEVGSAFVAVQHQVVETAPGGVSVVAQAIVGCLLGFRAEHWFSDVPYVGGLALYVMPEYRGGRYAFQLVRALEEWGRQHGAQECLMGVHTGGLEESRVRSLYTALGYESCGSDMRRSLQIVT